jgi:uncharacterized membrane protein (DUF2068 family)
MSGKNDRLVTWIALLKFVKGSSLLIFGTLALALPPRSLAAWSESVLGSFAPGRATLDHALGELWHIEKYKEKILAVGALLYAITFLVEGFGLWRRKVWAEWLTVVVTASFIPIEIYELVSKFSVAKVVTLALNVAIVAYLFHRRLAERHGGQAGKLSPLSAG